jgi:hypothetical protein
LWHRKNTPQEDYLLEHALMAVIGQRGQASEWAFEI